MKKFLLFVVFLQGCAMLGFQSIGNDPWLNEPAEALPADSEVPVELIYPVDSKKMELAVSMLTQKSAIPLSMKVASQILDGELADVDLLLEKAAKKEDAMASRREKEAADWRSISDFETEKKFLVTANEHKDKAKEIRGLKGEVTPYLVRGVQIRGSETGGFFVNYNKGNLWVIFEALGTYAEALEKQPLVIFLSQEPHQVYVSVSLAE